MWKNVVLPVLTVLIVGGCASRASDAAGHKSGAATPKAAAVAWVTALWQNDRNVSNLVCRHPAAGSVFVGFLDEPLVIRATSLAKTGDRWLVKVSAQTPDGGAGTDMDVSVVRENGRYLACP